MPPQDNTTRSSANPTPFSGITHCQRRSDGLLVLEKTVDFSHPSAPRASDPWTKMPARFPVPMAFLITDREAYYLHGGKQ